MQLTAVTEEGDVDVISDGYQPDRVAEQAGNVRVYFKICFDTKMLTNNGHSNERSRI